MLLILSIHQKHVFQLTDTDAFMKRVYFGGIQHEMRKFLWPFLLNHYPMDSNDEEREKIDAESLRDYKSVMSEWREAEKIIIQVHCRPVKHCQWLVICETMPHDYAK